MSLLDPSPSGHTKWSGSLLSFSDPPTPVSLSPPNTDGWTKTGWKLRPFIATCKGTIIVAVQSFLILWPHGLQHSRLPCPPLSPGVFSDLCPLSQWCHPTISSPVVPFSSCPQSFPTLGSFAMSQLFASGGLSVGASPLASVLPMNIQDWYPLGFTGLISLLSKGLVRIFSSTTIQKQQFFSSHIHTWWLEKPQLWLYGPLLAKRYLCFLICYLGIQHQN